MRSLVLLTALLLGAAAPVAQAFEVTQVRPARETPNLPDNAFESDADDPAIWVHPSKPERSLVVTAVKDGGLRVYDLQARLVQTIDPVITADGEGRINNVDVAYGLKLPGGGSIDVAVATDRALDVIRVFRINREADRPLLEVTADPAQRAFPQRPREDGTGLEDNPVDDQDTAYGLALWHDRAGGRLLAAVTQRNQPRLGLFRLTGRADGKVAVSFVRDFRVPVTFRGQNLRQENEDDPRRDWSPQFEGLVVDQRSGALYAGQEDVGIWIVDLKAGTIGRQPFVTTRGSVRSPFREPSSVIARDVEGLTIYYGPGRSGYLIASSQGGAHGDQPAPDFPYDDSFVVFDLAATPPRYLGSFRIRANGPMDRVQESDGADVLGFALPGYPQGLFVTQDGYNDDLDGLSGEPEASNFKYVPWERIANAFDPPLLIAPAARDPRRP
ncbi:MAG: phytase [Geminicoccaceae bacterium]